ncbi:MAG: multiheme c-type cytochrome [Terracidiphilus sp.]
MGRRAAGASAGALVWLIYGLAPGQPDLAQTAKPEAAPVTCATCHLGVASSYSHAPMRHALEIPGANPELETHPKLSAQMGAYTYTVQTKDGRSTYTVSDGTDSMTLPLRWLFGQHSQTWVLEKDGDMYEGLVSYYPQIEALGSTPGDSKIVPHNLTEAMGRKLDTSEINLCFNCHATHAVDGVKLTLDKLTPGLDCERCHVGSQQHMADAARDNYTTVPRKLRTMDAEDAANFCGQCHRTWDTVVRNSWKGIMNLRFQPYRLENSKCFSGNDRRISCLACHDPHQQVNHDMAFYDSKCMACHGEAKTSTALPNIKACPVAKANCASCHMPKLELPGVHALFTDHTIRIVKAGEPYPN